MLFMKTIFLYLTIVIISYRIGLIINKILKNHNYISIILYGFLTTVAILQIIYIPLILLHVSFEFVLYITIFIISILFITSFFICKPKQEKKFFKHNYAKLKHIKKTDFVIVSILILMVLTQATVSSLLFNENADDAFYVSLVEENQNSDAIYTHAPSLGSENTIFLSRYMISGYELSLSVLAKIFNIPSTTLCHTIIPFIMILFSYMAYYLLARKLLHKNRTAMIYVLLLSILFLFSGFTSRFRGIILLSRMWQGKEIFLNIVLTLILVNLISLSKYNEKRNIKALLILNLSAVFFTNTAIFLVPFAYIGFGIIALFQRNWKTFGKLLLTGLPIAIYGILYLIIAKNIHGSTYNENLNILDIFKNYIGTGYYFILYIFSIIIILLKGNSMARRYFVLVPLIYLVTLYNPFLTKYITQYFTGTEVFWRLFWLLPLEISIIYSFVILLNLKNNKVYKSLVLLIEILLLIFMGKFVYIKDNGFEIAENFYKIPQSIIDQTQYILDKETERNSTEPATVLAPPEPLHSATMRQLSSEINIIWSRDMYMYEILSQEELSELQSLRDIYRNAVPNLSIEDFNVLRKKYKINWIIIDNTNLNIVNYMNQTLPLNITEIGENILYQY